MAPKAINGSQENCCEDTSANSASNVFVRDISIAAIQAAHSASTAHITSCIFKVRPANFFNIAPVFSSHQAPG